MSLASKLRKTIVLVVIITFAFGLVIFTSQDSAEAYSTSQAATRPTFVFPSGALWIKEVRAQDAVQSSGNLAAVGTRPSAWSWDDIAGFGNDLACTSGVGAALSLASDVCDDTPIGSVVEAGQNAAECGMNLPLCITNWIYSVVGSGVAWAANGIVTLVTSTHEECLTGDSGGSGSFTNSSSLTGNCESRIKSDYFPTGYVVAKNLNDVIAQSYKQQTRGLRAELRELRAQQQELEKSGLASTPAGQWAAQPIQDRIKNLENQQNILLNRTSDGSLSDQATVKELRDQNLTFDPPKSAVSSITWDREYGKYVLIGLLLLVPMIIAACLQALISGKGHLMLRAVAINMPLAIVGMIVAPWLVRQIMWITDGFSSFIISDVQGDVKGYFSNMSPQAQAAMGIPLLLGFSLISIIFIFASLLVWFVLAMREASVALIAAFMPVALAASVWPALSKWAIRAIKLLFAAIISKVFIVGALSLGLGSFADSTESGNISFSHMVFGATIFFIAAFSPHLVMKFFDEIGDALNAAGGTGAISRGLGVAGNANGAMNLLRSGGGGGGAGGGLGGGSSTSNGLAQLGAELKGGAGGGSATPSETAATAGRIAAADGQSHSGQIHSAARGAGAGAGATDLDGLQGAIDQSMRANGVTAGTASAQQGETVGRDVTQSAIDHGLDAGTASAFGQSAAQQAMGAGHADLGAVQSNINAGAPAMAAEHQQNVTQARRQNERASGVRSVGRSALIGGIIAGPIGAAAMAARRSNRNAGIRERMGEA